MRVLIQIAEYIPTVMGSVDRGPIPSLLAAAIVISTLADIEQMKEGTSTMYSQVSSIQAVTLSMTIMLFPE